MPRPLRLEHPGALWHITNRGVEQRAIYIEDHDRLLFLELLRQIAQRYRWRLHQYCLMTNHFHLLIETIEPTLSRGMQGLEGKYADYFNKRHSRCGHLFQGRFGAQLVDEDAYLLTVARYIVLNPVRARMVAAPEEWQWSSYRSTAGLAKTPDWLHARSVLDRFDEWDRKMAMALYRRFVEESIGKSDTPWTSLVAGLYLGDATFIERVKHLTEEQDWKKEHPRRQQNVKAVDITLLHNHVVRYFRTSTKERTMNQTARLAFALLAREESIATLPAIAAFVGLTASAAGKLVRRAEVLRGSSTAFRQALSDVKLAITLDRFRV